MSRLSSHSTCPQHSSFVQLDCCDSESCKSREIGNTDCTLRLIKLKLSLKCKSLPFSTCVKDQSLSSSLNGIEINVMAFQKTECVTHFLLQTAGKSSAGYLFSKRYEYLFWIMSMVNHTWSFAGFCVCAHENEYSDCKHLYKQIFLLSVKAWVIYFIVTV